MLVYYCEKIRASASDIFTNKKRKEIYIMFEIVMSLILEDIIPAIVPILVIYLMFGVINLWLK